MNGITEKLTLINDSTKTLTDVANGLIVVKGSTDIVGQSFDMLSGKASNANYGADKIEGASSLMSSFKTRVGLVASSFKSVVSGTSIFKSRLERINIKKTLNQPLNVVERSILAITNASSIMGRALSKAGSTAKTMGSSFKSMFAGGKSFGIDSVARIGAAIYAAKTLFNVGKNLASKADDFAMMNVQLDNMNSGSRSKTDFKQDMKDSAQKTGLDTMDFADMVRNLDDTIGEKFSNANEMRGFAETMSKAFYVSGTGAKEQASTMAMLTEAMGMGEFQGRKLNQILAKAPMLANHLAAELGKPKEELIDLASQGKITTEVMMNAVARAGSDVDKAFGKMPVSWAQTTARFGNIFQESMMPVYDKLGELANSPAVKELAERIFSVIGMVTERIEPIIEGLKPLFDLVISTIDKISPSFDKMVAIVAPVFSDIVALVERIINKAVELGPAFEGPFKTIMELVSGVIGFIDSVIDIFEEVGPDLANPFAAIADFALSIFQSIDRVLIKSGLLKRLIQTFGPIVKLLGKIIGGVMDGVLWVVNKVASAIELVVSGINAVAGLSEKVGGWLATNGSIVDIAKNVYNTVSGGPQVEYLGDKPTIEGASGGARTSPVIIANVQSVADAIADAKNTAKWEGDRLGFLQGQLKRLEDQQSSMVTSLVGISTMPDAFSSVDQVASEINATKEALADYFKAQDVERKKAQRHRAQKQTVKIDKESIDLLDALARLQFVNKYTSIQPNFVQNIVMKGGDTNEYEKGGKALAKAFDEQMKHYPSSLGSI